MGLYIMIVEDSPREYEVLEGLFLLLCRELALVSGKPDQDPAGYVLVHVNSLSAAQSTIEEFARRRQGRLLIIFDVVLFSRLNEPLPLNYIKTLVSGLPNHPDFKPRVIIYSARDPDTLLRDHDLEHIDVFWKWDLLEPETIQQLKDIVWETVLSDSPYIDQTQYPIRADAADILALLRETRRAEPDAPGKLLSYFRRQLKHLQDTFLYPDRSEGEDPFPESQAFAENVQSDSQWSRIVTDLTTAAYHLWSDTAADFARDARGKTPAISDELQRSQLQFLAHYARLLLLLSLQARLYLVRAYNNYSYFAPGFERRTRKDTATLFTHYVRQYDQLLDNWDTQLYQLTGLHYFAPDMVDVDRLRAFAREFGPESVDPTERGWLAQVEAARRTLWYEYNRAQKRMARISHHWSRFILLTIGNIFTGYGVKPWRFILAFAAAIVLLAGAFYGDDLFARTSACRGYAAAPSLDTILTYLVSAFSSLAGRITGSHPCGPGFDVLTSIGSFFGYFLLAVLASLLFQLLNPDEQ